MNTRGIKLAKQRRKLFAPTPIFVIRFQLLGMGQRTNLYVCRSWRGLALTMNVGRAQLVNDNGRLLKLAKRPAFRFAVLANTDLRLLSEVKAALIERKIKLHVKAISVTDLKDGR